jgi:hypothetical protein
MAIRFRSTLGSSSAHESAVTSRTIECRAVNEEDARRCSFDERFGH